MIVQTKGGPVTIHENEIAALKLDFTEIDVDRELEAFARWISAEPGRAPALDRAMKAIRGWLGKARPRSSGTSGTRRRGEMPEHVRASYEVYRAEGLIPEGFEPLGESDRERLKSLDAKAYTTWIRQHPHLDLSPEELRTTYLNRHRDAGIDQAAGVA